MIYRKQNYDLGPAVLCNFSHVFESTTGVQQLPIDTAGLKTPHNREGTRLFKWYVTQCYHCSTGGIQTARAIIQDRPKTQLLLSTLSSIYESAKPAKTATITQWRAHTTLTMVSGKIDVAVVVDCSGLKLLWIETVLVK